jgi:hypothetical protein
MHRSGQGIVRRDACDGARVAEQDREAEEGEEEGQEERYCEAMGRE